MDQMKRWIPMKRRLVATATVTATALALLSSACGDDGAGDGDRIRVALGDIESVETLALFVALERVREEGVEVELTELADEDLANQAVVGGQADVGLGAPYALIEGSDAPLRIFCQLTAARFFPVVDQATYPDWQSLDGETFTVHSRGSTTEALAQHRRGGGGDRVRRDQLRLRRRGARHRAAAWQHQGDGPRHPQQATT